jgi:starch synthase
MAQTLNVLFLAAEADPFVKVGGLGDVAGALPRALRALPPEVLGETRLDIRLVLPMHSVIRAEGLRPVAVFPLTRGETELQVEVLEGILDGMPVYFVSGDPIRASGSVYSMKAELDAEKYAFFSLAAMELPRQIGWNVDLVHANDWHTAVAGYSNLARRWEAGARRVASLITLHNLPFMGPDISSILESYGLPIARTDLPEWARVLPLPLGLWAADAIVAVSPSYADEILSPEFGSGLQDFLGMRRDTVHGILNGIDTASYNPTDDPAIAMPFSSVTLADRIPNKSDLQERLGLPLRPDVPLLGVVSRMDVQKGMDLAIKALRSLKADFQAVILGAGDPALEQAARQLQAYRPENIRVETRFDAKLARQIYAGADIFLMPSRYEPCGLSQMIAMRYGCVPLVRAAGGLKDTVTKETGFIFEKPVVQSLSAAIRSALKVYPDREHWAQLQQAGMSKDFSWANSARQYFLLYQSLLHETTPAAT